MKHTLSLLCLSLMMTMTTTVYGRPVHNPHHKVEVHKHVCDKHCKHHQPTKTVVKVVTVTKHPTHLAQGTREFDNNSPEAIRLRQELRRGTMYGCR